MIEIKIAVCDIPELFASFTKKEDDLSDKLDKAEAQRDLLEKQLERYGDQCCALKEQIKNQSEDIAIIALEKRERVKDLVRVANGIKEERDGLKARLSRYEAIPGFQAPSEPMPMHMMTRSEAASNIGKMLNHLRSGERIEAIKIVKKLTGCGLKEAKDACDNLPHDALSPSRFSTMG